MKKEQLLSLIFIAEKITNPISNILLKISNNKISGEILDGSFTYKIDDYKKIIPIQRLWESLLQEAKGKTERRYLESISKLIEQYKFPEELLNEVTYTNPENGDVKYYLSKIKIW